MCRKKADLASFCMYNSPNVGGIIYNVLKKIDFFNTLFFPKNYNSSVPTTTPLAMKV